MPRQINKGLKYTFLDANFFNDRKVKRLQRMCGMDSPYVFLALLCLIAPEGYYIRYDQNAVYDLADMTGYDEDRITEILETCGKVGLLDCNLMQGEKVLTSHGIQSYYASAKEHAKSKASIDKYSLISLEEMKDNTPSEGITSEEMRINSKNGTFLPKNKEGMQQIEKNRIEEKRIEKKKNYSYCSLEEEKEEILSFCFFQNWASPNEEVKKIIAYNNTGGRCWEKMSRVEKESALALWKQQPEQKPRLSKDFISFWYDVYSWLRSLEAPYEIRMDALSDDIGWIEQAGCLVLKASDRLREFIERNMDFFKPLIREFQQRRRLREDLHYSIIPPNNN